MIVWMHHNIWLQMTIFLISFMCALWLVKSFMGHTTSSIETFQTQPYTLKQDSETYDPFYIDRYDTLFETDKYSEEDHSIITSNTTLNKDSSILDVGCGTGSLMKRFIDDGYVVFGIDESRFMVEHAQEKIEKGEVYCQNILQSPLLYENNSFSHILCTHFTIYEIENKRLFFQYCHSWLKLGGFLGIHMVDVDSYKLIVPHSEWFSIAGVTDSVDRIINTKIQKKDYTYTNKYQMNNTKPVKQLETFEVGSKTRTNERTLYMIDKSELVQIALAHGYRLYKEVSYSKQIMDSHQYMVIFQKEFQNE